MHEILAFQVAEYLNKFKFSLSKMKNLVLKNWKIVFILSGGTRIAHCLDENWKYNSWKPGALMEHWQEQKPSSDICKKWTDESGEKNKNKNSCVVLHIHSLEDESE